MGDVREQNLLDKVTRQDLDHAEVAGKQIMSALLWEIDCKGGLPNDSLLFKALQKTANEARGRGLLFNPNPFSQETYSTSVGNTARMLPSRQGWEMTKGILTRRVHDLRERITAL